MLYYLYKIGRRLALKARIETCYRLAVILADIYCFFAWNDRRNLRANLEVVLGANNKKLIDRCIRDVFRNFGKYLFDFFRFSKITDEYIKNTITVKGRENLDAALVKGKGVILLSAHIGNWELGAAIIASFGHPFHAIVMSHKEKKINNFFVEQRQTAKINVIGLGAQLKKCFSVLKKNHLLAIVGDRDFSNHGIKINFFGRSAIMPKGPAIFSLRTGAPILPVFLIRKEDDKFDLTFEKPLEPKRTTNDASEIKNTMSQYISVIERYVKSHPDQWYVFRKLWS
ncbi:MAG: lysophospholipid acyltransferase family protein [Candidatus Omnitrophica bacterium]|nr:lysophospholipid acyltransferase family protein [Candidatus Omnitrophota bacterium]